MSGPWRSGGSTPGRRGGPRWSTWTRPEKSQSCHIRTHREWQWFHLVHKGTMHPILFVLLIKGGLQLISLQLDVEFELAIIASLCIWF